MLKNRFLTPLIIEDLSEKMVFVGGPLQVGKTTLAKEIISSKFKNTASVYIPITVRLSGH